MTGRNFSRDLVRRDVRHGYELIFETLVLGLLEVKDPRMAWAVALRYGLNDGKPKTLSEVASMMEKRKNQRFISGIGVTQEVARQILCKAGRILRHPSRIKKLKRYLTCEEFPR